MNNIEIHSFIKSIMTQAATVCRAFLAEHSLDVNIKPDGQYVTALDHYMDQWFKTHLLEFFPNYHWLSEESQIQGVPGQGMTWLVDPIDGTKYLAKERNNFTMVIALMQDHAVCAAGVINPITESLWVVSDQTKENHVAEELSRYQDIFLVSHRIQEKYLTGHPRVQAMGSIAQRICVCVSQGGLAAASFYPLAVWDVLPAAYIAIQYGYGVYDLNGQAYDLTYQEPWSKRLGIVVVREENKKEVFELIGQRRI